MQAPFRVFVCSTYSDLADERSAVLDAIRRLHLEHGAMEFFGARTEQPLDTCLNEVRASQMLVVIVGHRYGTIAPSLDISFAEAEYREGHGLKKPCLVYMRSDDVPVLPKHVERDPVKLKLLEQWKAVLEQRHVVCRYRAPRDLAMQVAADVSRTIRDYVETSKTIAEAQEGFRGSILDELGQLVGAAIQQGISEQTLLSSIRRSILTLMAEANGSGPTVFVSYAAADRDVVRQVAAGLQKGGIRVWFDESRLLPGANWVKEIQKALDSADVVVFFISPHSVQSGWAQKELQLALHRQVSGEKGAMLLPVLLAQAEVPPLLRDIQWLDMTNKDVNKGVDRLLQAIRSHTRWSGAAVDSEGTLRTYQDGRIYYGSGMYPTAGPSLGTGVYSAGGRSQPVPKKN